MCEDQPPNPPLASLKAPLLCLFPEASWNFSTRNPTCFVILVAKIQYLYLNSITEESRFSSLYSDAWLVGWSWTTLRSHGTTNHDHFYD